MKYEGQIYRPPTEAYTFLLQVTAGCTHNACRFCGMFRDKKFHLIDPEIVEANLVEAYDFCQKYGRTIDRMFLTDGDVFSLPADKIEEIILKVREYFPDCETFTMYAAVGRIKKKTDEELKRLAELGVNDLYIGYESGDDETLAFMNKGHTVADAIEQAERLNKFGIRHHALMVIGLSGKGTVEEAGKKSADLINKIHPGLAMFFTLYLRENSDLYDDVKSGRFAEPSAREMLEEEIITLEGIEDPGVYFWASHMFNPVPVQGSVGTDKAKMLNVLRRNLGN